MGDAAAPLRDFLVRWRMSAPPLRPHPGVARAIAPLLPEHDAGAPILLLGVTPELAVLPRHVVALDRSQRMIDHAWPGDSETRRAVRGEWRAMPFEPGSMAGAIGDGSLSPLFFPGEYELILEQLTRVLLPGGLVVLRCFTTPDRAETLAELAAEALSGAIPFHVFKLRFNVAAAREAGSVEITSDAAFRRFQTLFPDREVLSRASGWSLATIAEMDCYEGEPANHSYPTRAELKAMFGARVADLRFVETQGYPLAERCPLLVMHLS